LAMNLVSKWMWKTRKEGKKSRRFPPWINRQKLTFFKFKNRNKNSLGDQTNLV
jgi:hypothetical protein